MIQFILLAIIIVLLVILINKVVTLQSYTINTLTDIFNKVYDIETDIDNSTAKLQDRIYGIHESIENHQKDMVELTKRALEEQVQQMKLVEKLNTSNTKEIVSTAMKDAAAHRQDIYNTAKDTYNKITTHDNYIVAHNKEVRQMLSELLSAIQALSVAKTDNVSSDTATAIEKPKKAIRRNKRKYTKDTEEVKE